MCVRTTTYTFKCFVFFSRDSVIGKFTCVCVSVSSVALGTAESVHISQRYIAAVAVPSVVKWFTGYWLMPKFASIQIWILRFEKSLVF